ncbi:MAG TPA: DUF4132 domain-containing protein [Polyangiaceae bacterium]
MDKIFEAFRMLKARGWGNASTLEAAEQYVRSGDVAVLKRIRPDPSHDFVWGRIVSALEHSTRWTDHDRRLTRVMAKADGLSALGSWVSHELEAEEGGDDLLAPVVQELKQLDFDESAICKWILCEVRNIVYNSKPTSAGRYLLSASTESLRKAMVRPASKWGEHLPRFADLVTNFGLGRLPELIDAFLTRGKKTEVSAEIFTSILRATGDRYEAKLVATFEDEPDIWWKFRQARALFEFDPVKHRGRALEAARRALVGPSANNNDGPIGAFMVDAFGAEAAPDLVRHFERTKNRNLPYERWIVDSAAKLGRDAVPVFMAALEHRELCAQVVGHLIKLDLSELEPRIVKELRTGLAGSSADEVVTFARIAAGWKPGLVEPELWSLLEHKSKLVREAAARALARLEESVVAPAAKRLEHKKADVRSAAVLVLDAIGSPSAIAQLELRLERESNDDVRDAILTALQEVHARQGRVPTRADIAARIESAAAKLASPVAEWLREESLPALKWNDGAPLTLKEVRYLCYRQSRARGIAPDLEARPMYALLDRASSAPFARAVFERFVASGAEANDRWALAIAGCLGDDFLVTVLVTQIREWADQNRGKLAEYAVEALAQLGTDAALLAVDAISIRYRNKMKNVGRAGANAFASAAERLGIDPDELGDRVVPWLGFEAGKARVLTVGDKPIEVRIGLDFKLYYTDLTKNRAVGGLPKSAAKKWLVEMKELVAALREVAKAQFLRMETQLVRQRRWTSVRFGELFLLHPLLVPFAVRLVWARYDESGRRTLAFRALEDRTLTTANNEPCELPQTGTVGIVHPLELSESELVAWKSHLVDHEVEPPFPQLDRDVERVDPNRRAVRILRDYSGTRLNAMTFKGRAERLGWTRGSVTDGGGIGSYMKYFPGAGVDVILKLDGFFIGAGLDADGTLTDACFVKTGSVQVGSYVYDEPKTEEDRRIVALGDVPPIAYSEAVGDLKRIAGIQDDGER